MIKLFCDGRDPDGRICRESVGKDEERQKGWTVVVTYPLSGVGDPRRRLLCRVCTRNFEGLFKDA